MSDLAGQRALVTGASRGVGLGIAKALAAGNATVILSARNENALNQAKADIESAGGKALVQAGDLSTRESCRALAKRCGEIDILVNNAALTIMKYQSILVRDDEFWDLSFQLNVIAPVTLIQEFGRGMAERRRGVIINISSLGAQYSPPLLAHYSAWKSALEAMSKVAAMDLASSRVRVVVVNLGLTNTEALREAAAVGVTSEAIAKLVPIGRPNSVGDVGAMCRFLASDQAATITGSIITIDGGMSAGNFGIAGSFGRSNE